ncbi:hypothetical protein Bbelb_408310 [Branchiostoma belcheri]|nr:hypothetical protein Bbelb_408310 [Branchiostoma belcheri]
MGVNNPSALPRDVCCRPCREFATLPTACVRPKQTCASPDLVLFPTHARVCVCEGERALRRCSKHLLPTHHPSHVETLNTHKTNAWQDPVLLQGPRHTVTQARRLSAVCTAPACRDSLALVIRNTYKEPHLNSTSCATARPERLLGLSQVHPVCMHGLFVAPAARARTGGSLAGPSLRPPRYPCRVHSVMAHGEKPVDHCRPPGQCQPRALPSREIAPSVATYGVNPCYVLGRYSWQRTHVGGLKQVPVAPGRERAGLGGDVSVSRELFSVCSGVRDCHPRLPGRSPGHCSLTPEAQEQVWHTFRNSDPHPTSGGGSYCGPVDRNAASRPRRLEFYSPPPAF